MSAMDLSEIVGKNVLLILVSRGVHGRVQLVVSKLELTGHRVGARYSDRHPPIEIDAARALGAGGSAANLTNFVAPIPGSEIVIALAARADRYLPLLVPEPVPGIALVDSPFYGVTLNASHDITLLRPPTESERIVGSWSRGWSAEQDASDKETDEDEDSDEISQVLRASSAPHQVWPRVSFYLVNQSDKSTRRGFINELLAQRFPLHDAGLRDDDPAGWRGWVSLRHGVPRNDWLRLLGWLRGHPLVRELSEVTEDGLGNE